VEEVTKRRLRCFAAARQIKLGEAVGETLRGKKQGVRHEVDVNNGCKAQNQGGHKKRKRTTLSVQNFPFGNPVKEREKTLGQIAYAGKLENTGTDKSKRKA